VASWFVLQLIVQQLACISLGANIYVYVRTLLIWLKSKNKDHALALFMQLLSFLWSAFACYEMVLEAVLLVAQNIII
jgi:hypothetical protein